MMKIQRAFGFALSGLVSAWRTQFSFRCEVLATVFIIPVALWIGKDALTQAVLISSWLLVLIVELLNSAIEHAIDRVSLDFHPLSKSAKDMGGAAVFVSLCLTSCTWGLVLKAFLGY